MAEEKKRLTAVERAELALAEAKAKAEEKNKLKRKAALVELARRRQAMLNADTKVASATEAGLCEGSKATRPLRLPAVSDRALGYLLHLLRMVEFEGTLSRMLTDLLSSQGAKPTARLP